LGIGRDLGTVRFDQRAHLPGGPSSGGCQKTLLHLGDHAVKATVTNLAAATAEKK
jgi:hypothetical protein